MQGFEVANAPVLCWVSRSNAELKGPSQANRLAAPYRRARIACLDVLGSAIYLVLDLQGSRAGRPVYGSCLGTHLLTLSFLSSGDTRVWLSPAPSSSSRIRLVIHGRILAVDGALPFRGPVQRPRPIMSRRVPPWTRYDQPLISIVFGRRR
jgi:hypothetical protein